MPVVATLLWHERTPAQARCATASRRRQRKALARRSRIGFNRAMESCCGPLITTEQPLGIVLLFTTGVLISLGHCIGMCGPIVTAFGLTQRGRGVSGWGHVPILARYHTGRIISYMIIGAVLGLVGSATRLAGATQILQGGLSILAGLFMLLLGLGLVGWLPTASWVESAGAADRVGGWIRALLNSASGIRQFGLGIANGFLPCGPVIAVALTAAAAADAVQGMGAMLAYGLGTVPALVVLGLGAGHIPARLRTRFFRLGALLVLVIGLQLSLRGLSALGVVPHLKFGEFVVW